MSTLIFDIAFRLVIALAMIVMSSLMMIEKKRMYLFMPFFALGLIFCLSSALSFYGFFGLATDVLTFQLLIFVVWIFYLLLGANK